MKRGDTAVSLLSAVPPSVVLVGPPRAVRGSFTLHNPTAERLVVPPPTIRAQPATGRGAKAARFAALPEAGFRMRRIIARPNAQRHVPIELNLPLTTEPGTYHLELDVDGETRQVVAHVTELVEFTIEPDHLVIPNRPGEKVHKRIVITNHGNVPLHVKSIGAVVLDEELAHCRAIRGALADVGDDAKGFDEVLGAFVKRYRDAFETLALKVQNDKQTVGSGDVCAFDLGITVPEKANARARYFGFAAISRGNLSFTVVPD